MIISARINAAILGVTFFIGCTVSTVDGDGKPGVWNFSGPVPGRAIEVIETTRRALPCEVADHEWGGLIEFVEGPIACGDVRAAGCWIGAFYLAPHFLVTYADDASDTAIIHEVGHYGFTLCGDGSTTSEPAWFHEWVEATRAASREAP